jgi:G:T/U-mismatch repair DNA glycosylase
MKSEVEAPRSVPVSDEQADAMRSADEKLIELIETLEYEFPLCDIVGAEKTEKGYRIRMRIYVIASTDIRAISKAVKKLNLKIKHFTGHAESQYIIATFFFVKR